MKGLSFDIFNTIAIFLVYFSLGCSVEYELRISKKLTVNSFLKVFW